MEKVRVILKCYDIVPDKIFSTEEVVYKVDEDHVISKEKRGNIVI